ncbi:PASTA domain-containing protein [Catenulispora yoronensis]
MTAAVAAPALIGLAIALVVNTSGASPKSGGPGTGPGAAQPVDLPTSVGTSDYGSPDDSTSSSSAFYPHSASSPHGRGSGSGSATASGTAPLGGNGTRSSALSPPYSSLDGSSSASTTTPGASPSSTTSGPTPPSSTSSSASTVPVPDVTGKTEGTARTMLTSQGFQVQVGTKDSGTGGTCTVGSQNPSGGNALYGSTVTINLTCA